MNNNVCEKELPAVCQDSLTMEATAPAMLTVSLGKNIKITLPKSEDMTNVAEFINKINTLPREERTFNAKIGDALVTDLYSHDIKFPVCVQSDINVNITFDDIMNSDTFNDIIDVPPDDEK